MIIRNSFLGTYISGYSASRELRSWLIFCLFAAIFFGPVSPGLSATQPIAPPIPFGFIGVYGPCDFYVVDIATDGEGNVHVIDPRFRSVTRCGRDGTPQLEIQDSAFSWLRGLGVDSQGRIYVLDPVAGTIRVYSSLGTIIDVWEGFQGAESMDVDENDRIFVALNGNGSGVDAIATFDTAGNELMRFGSTGSGPGEFNRLHDVAVAPDGSIYVADTGNCRVQKFDLQGNYLLTIGKWGSLPGEFKEPVSVSVDSSGNFFVSDRRNYRVQKFDENGNFLQLWGSKGTDPGQFFEHHGLTVAPDDTIWVAGYHGHDIQHFDNNGNLLERWQGHVSGPGEFSDPRGIGILANTLFAIDGWNQRVQAFDVSSGQYLYKWGERGQGDATVFNFPRALAIGPDGDLYISDDDHVRRIKPDGTFVTRYPRLEGARPGSRGLAISPTGILFQTDKGNHRIIKADTNTGETLLQWGTFGSGPGEFNRPFGVALGPDGSVYVADTNNHRIQQFTQDGEYIQEWGADGELLGPVALAIDEARNILYVGDEWRERVVAYDLDGNFLFSWGSPGQGLGEFSGIWDIAVDQDSSVYVSENDNGRVQKFVYSVYYVHVGGTRGNGPSTPGDWSLSNCYPTIMAANDQVSSASDKICLYKETHEISGGNVILNAGYVYNADEDNDYLSCIVTYDADSASKLILKPGQDTTIKGITFQGQTTNWSSALELTNDSASPTTITVQYSRFLNNTGQQADGGVGAAIRINDSTGGTVTINMSNCSFEGNSARHQGGALYISNNCNGTISNCEFIDNFMESGQIAGKGGAIMINGSEGVIITNSTFSGNKSTFSGGAIFCKDSDLSITGSTFENNEANYEQGNSWTAGGAIRVVDYTNDGSAKTFTLSNCTFTNNTVNADSDREGDGGAIGVKGLDASDLVTFTARGCMFSGNYSHIGGAVHLGRYCHPATIERCLFDSNYSRSNGGAIVRGGGPADCAGQTLTLKYCIFLGNKAGVESDGTAAPDESSLGGAVHSRLYPQVIAYNCSFLDNKSSGGVSNEGDALSNYLEGGSFDSDDKRHTLKNCAFYGTGTNSEIYADDDASNYAFKEVVNCAYESGELSGNVGTSSNNVALTSNPFTSLTDATLSLDSPCIDAGENSVWSGIPNITDIEGNSITDASGNIVAAGGTVDIGAYEFTNVFCEGDFDHDGDVDGLDLAVFAADFGRTDCGGDCEGDFDSDDDVDGSDLAVFAADFGRTDCPMP